MKHLLFSLAVVLLGYSGTAQNTNTMVESYIQVKDALVNGHSKAASTALATFQQSVKSSGDFKGKEVLLKAVEKMSNAANIESQRAAFNDVSVNLWKVVEKAEKMDAPVYYQYCPMKNGYWLSKEKDIKNPYYGASMLTCGKVVETKL